MGTFNEDIGIGILSILFVLVMLIPGLAVSVRRLHDVGKSGYMLLLVFVPFIGPFWLLMYYLKDSEPGTNEFGLNPKGIESGAGSDTTAGEKAAGAEQDNLVNKLISIIVPLVVFLAITIIYFSPVLEGKKLKQHDITMFKEAASSSAATRRAARPSARGESRPARRPTRRSTSAR